MPGYRNMIARTVNWQEPLCRRSSSRTSLKGVRPTKVDPRQTSTAHASMANDASMRRSTPGA